MDNNKSLIWAAEKGNWELVKKLLNSGADVNYRDSDGETALFKAVNNNHPKIVQFLINSGANVNIVDKNDISILMIAANNKNTNKKIVQFLINSGANYHHIHTYLHTVYHWKYADKLESKIWKIIYQCHEKKKEIIILQEKCYQEIIDLLMNNYAINGNSSQQEKLIIDSLKFLENKIQAKYKAETLVSSSLQKEFINSLKFDELNYSLLHIAVLNDWQKLITYLINKWPIEINYEDISGNSAWNHACMLLKKESALKIKKYFQLTNKCQKFLKTITPSSTNWNTIETGIYKIASENRKEIFDYYSIDNGIDALEYFKYEVNSIIESKNNQDPQLSPSSIRQSSPTL